ncbi:MAG: HAMP domain-containing histidine kinase [Prevotellaceae bacterium]|jgi:signal transduction histidine kinase|nr:HAMP domain-containing histidine kinase [Prevotellaceae bacterium]
MKKKRTTGIFAIACFAAAAGLFGYSLTNCSASRFYSSAMQKCEAQLREQQQIAALTGEQLRVQPANVTGNRYVSAFCFINGQLQSWTTRDIAVDESELFAIDTLPAFVRLGHSWYVAQACEHDSVRIITAVLIKRGYSYANDFLQPQLSPFLAAAGVQDIVPAGNGDRNTVLTATGNPLFTLVFEEGHNTSENLFYRWLAIALVIAGLFLMQHYFAGNRACAAAICLLGILRYGILLGKTGLYGNSVTLFFPSLYADSLFIPSLGSLLLHALFFFLMAMFCLQHYKKTKAYTAGNPRWATVAGWVAVIISGWFIHYAWRSLIINATIPLHLPQLDRLTAGTFIAYGVMALLFATLFLFLYMTLHHFLSKKYHLKTQGYILVFTLGAALYTLTTLGIYGHRKENLQVRAWADKLVSEHDPAAELFLNEMAAGITSDTIIADCIEQDMQAETIHQYLSQRYFQGYMQHYDLQVTICPRGTTLQVDGAEEEISCNDFFAEEIEKYGVLLNPVFYYLANDNGRNSYLGQLHCMDGKGNETDVFLEIDSKLLSGGEGYPELLLDKNSAGRTQIPSGYSYARYAGNRLAATGGDFRYPYEQAADIAAEKTITDGYAHFFFHPDACCRIVISRTVHSFWGFLILFSYLFFFFAFGLFLLAAIAGIPLNWRVSKSTFRRKIAALLIVSFIVSILCTAVGTIFYNIHRFGENAMRQMDDKMQTVLTQLDYLLNNASVIDGENLWALDRELVQLSNSMKIDVNIYDRSGRLVTSSRPEVFEKQLQSERINRAAFEVLTAGGTLNFVHKERIGNLSFYSVYATYYNVYGEAVAYVNIPYFSKRMQDIRAASAIITAIINVYILALIGALFLGTALTSRLLRPLQIVRRNMQALDVTKKMEYIAYHEKDELGDLIRAYNQMIDALEESTHKLAQSERESAWREMARQIAHEIKNPLTPMRLSIQHLIRLKKENAPAWQSRFDELAAALLEQIDTLAKTASEFSNFAQASTGKPEQVSLNNLLNELKPLFDGYEKIRFEWHLKTAHATVCGHADQLSRVLVNLLTNAVQALQSCPDGKIAVTLSAADAGYAISVEDNGAGVDEQLHRQLFMPNFTTKSSGSGLGLAISKKIMEQEGGGIACAPSTLGGACFTVYFNHPS